MKLTVNLLTPAHHAVDVVAVAETALAETVVVVDAVVDAKRREAQKLRDLVGAYSADHSLGNIDDISDVRVSCPPRLNLDVDVHLFI